MIRKNVLYAFILISSAQAVVCDQLEPMQVAIFGNKVGLDKNDQCMLTEDNEIICTSGAVFGRDKPLDIIVGSSTGTPPHLMFSNYIGSRIIEAESRISEDNDRPLVGAERREIYCVGPCKPMDKKR